MGKCCLKKVIGIAMCIHIISIYYKKTIEKSVIFFVVKICQKKGLKLPLLEPFFALNAL